MEKVSRAPRKVTYGAAIDAITVGCWKAGLGAGLGKSPISALGILGRGPMRRIERGVGSDGHSSQQGFTKCGGYS